MHRQQTQCPVALYTLKQRTKCVETTRYLLYRRLWILTSFGLELKSPEYVASFKVAALMLDWFSDGPGARFSKVPKSFRPRKAIAKSRILWLQSCFIHIFAIWTEVPFIQQVSGVYTSPFLDTDEQKMALWARKVSGAYEKRAPGHSRKYKTPFFVVKGYQIWSVPRFVGLSFCLLSVLFLFWSVCARISIFWKTNAPRKKHMTPLPPHNGHF